MTDDVELEVSKADQHDEGSAHDGLRFASADGSAFNTIRFPLMPVACWRLGRPGFAFDSSFIAPDFKREIQKLRGIVEKNPRCPAALFGHCDPVGSDDLNKTLSDRRAIAVYALLTRQVAMWADLYDKPQVGDTWGTKALQTILASVSDEDGNVYYDSAVHAIDGDYGSATTAAVKRFQPSASLSPTGKADAATRDALFAAYMDWLCTPVDLPGSPPFQMQTGDFLGNGGLGELPEMSLQGCSEFNQLVVLSSSEMNGGNTAKRNVDDAPNRRVLMFLFPEGTLVSPSTWPCPKVKEGFTACKKAFWPDGEARRKHGKQLREYKETRDTMACRFYDRFARRSPCESLNILNIWLQDERRQRMPSAKCRITIGTRTFDLTANSEGMVTVSAPPMTTICGLEWGEVTDESSSEPRYRYRSQLDVRRNPQDPETRSLDNLAYDGATVTDRRDAFKADYPDHDIEVVHAQGLPKKGEG